MTMQPDLIQITHNVPENSLIIGFDGKLSSKVLIFSRCDVIFTAVPFVHALVVFSHTPAAICLEVFDVRLASIDAF